jgi:VanZ family protein
MTLLRSAQPSAARPLALAVGASIVVLASAPAIGQIRGAIQAAFPGQYRLILGAFVAAIIVAGVLYAMATVREGRARRLSLIGAAIVVGAVYSLATATGNANVDAVERFHFAEYGFLALLYHRAWRGAHAPAALGLAFLAVFMVGTLDEGIQWFVPIRVGEWSDVLLNSVAIICGLTFSAALPQRTADAQPDRSRRRVLLGMLGAASLLFAIFFYLVHVGHEVRDPSIGAFRSRYSASELLANAADRAHRWQTDPLTTLRRYSREDQYMSEGLWHIQARNEASNDPLRQWRENLILERYFQPVLDFPTYNTPNGGRWPAEQRKNVGAIAAGDTRPWASKANPYPIFAWLR